MSEFDLPQFTDASISQVHKKRLRRIRRVNWLMTLAARVGFTLAVFVGVLVLTVCARNQINNSQLVVAYDYSTRIAETDPAIQSAHYLNIDYYANHQVFVSLGSQLLETSDLQHEPDVVEEEAHTGFVSFFRTGL